MDKNTVKTSKQHISQKSKGDVFGNDLTKLNDNSDIISEIEKQTFSDIELAFGKMPTNGNYTLEDKIQMILVMESCQRQIGDKMVPKFTQIANDTGMNYGTLWEWWDKKDEIIKNGSAVIDKMDDYVRIKMGIQSLRILNAISHKDLNGEKLKDLTLALSTFINKSRLLGGRSTSNAAVKVEKTVKLVIPDED